ncbi:sensor domain-containing phosphodiesterase [Escherichia fergusonii]|uniref:sensor domain-containing phosphodiesterase n=1 Tax=Escherichia fergusonii TaxID=564 RepID=UPI001CD0AD86|nr:EAL domain-containing protein [Escherichia fergusonii]
MYSISEKVNSSFKFAITVAIAVYILLSLFTAFDFHKKIAESSSKNHQELLRNNLRNYFSKVEKEADALKDALYLLQDEEEIKRALIHRMAKIEGINLVGLMMNNGKYYSFIRTPGGEIKLQAKFVPGRPLTGADGEVIDENFNPLSRPWNDIPPGAVSKWASWYDCYGMPGKKCFTFSLSPSENEKNNFAIKLIHLDLDEKYLTNFLNAQGKPGDIIFLENNGRIINGNEESTLHLIVKDTNGEYRTSNDTDEYLEKVIILPKLPDVKFHYFYALNSKLSYLNKSFVLMFMSGIFCFFLLWYIIIVITRKISGESGKLVRNLEHLGNSVYKEDKVDISTEDSREIVELKKIINTIGEKYKERIERMLNLVSYEQGTSFYINTAVIETNNKDYVAAGMICLYGLEFAEAIYGSEKYNAIISELKSKISAKYSSHCDIIKISNDRYLLLCYTDCEEFISNFSVLNLPENIFCLRNIYVHKTALCETFSGKDVSIYEGKLKLAMTAMRENKQSEFLYYDDIKLHELDQKVWVASNIKQAISRGEFYLVYQPIVNIDSNEVVGAEALCRWNSAEYGFISPAVFVSIAEDIGLIKELGDYILENAIREFSQFSNEYVISDEFLLHINVSPWQLNDFDFHHRVLQLIKDFNINAGQICLEITESAVKEINDSFYNNIIVLKGNGIKIALDDFGSGLADLKKLYKVKPDSIKIDSEFTSGVFDETNRIVWFISSFAREENLPVIAEGVETEHQAKELQKLGFSQVQGYLYQKPLPFSEWHIDSKPQKRS